MGKIPEMKLKSKWHLVFTLILLIIPMVIFFWSKNTGYFDLFFHWSQRNIIVFTTILLILKVFGIVFPPLPGGIFTLGVIPIIGWVNALIIDLLGSLIGSGIAYFLGQKFGKKLLLKFFDPDTVNKILKIKIKPNRELESIIILRILGNSVMEIVAYGSGILKVNFPKFIIGSILAHLIYGIPSFWLANNLFSVKNIPVSILLFILTISLLWKIKGRYFE